MILVGIVGLLVGILLDWTANDFPRFSGHSALLKQVRSPFVPAVWRLLISFRQKSARTRLLWLDVFLEILPALLFAYLWTYLGWTWNLIISAVICTFFILVALVDIKYRLIPNVLVVPAMGVVMGASLVFQSVNIWSVMLGGVVGAGLFAIVAWLRPGELGGGDVKLAALIGLLFGFPAALWALVIGVLSGGIAAIIVLWRVPRGAQMPYAPFLCFGALLALFYNPFLR